MSRTNWAARAVPPHCHTTRRLRLNTTCIITGYVAFPQMSRNRSRLGSMAPDFGRLLISLLERCGHTSKKTNPEIDTFSRRTTGSTCCTMPGLGTFFLSFVLLKASEGPQRSIPLLDLPARLQRNMESGVDLVPCSAPTVLASLVLLIGDPESETRTRIRVLCRSPVPASQAEWKAAAMYKTTAGDSFGHGARSGVYGHEELAEESTRWFN
jgi:hypothetical protein